MRLPAMNFGHVRSLGPGGQRDGFEQFVCQIVAQDSPEAGSHFVSLHGAGGDGGVECYWTLASGDEYGWQAKYWTEHSSVNKAQLDKSVAAALQQHPKLRRYTIAIAADPTGPTGRPGKSLLELIEGPRGWTENWRGMATALGMEVEFTVEWATNLLTRLERLDLSGVQRRYWFDADVLGPEWWTERHETAEAAARPRYVPELNVDVPALGVIAALCGDDDWSRVIQERIDRLREACGQFRYVEHAEAANASVVEAVAGDVDRMLRALLATSQAERLLPAVDVIATAVAETDRQLEAECSAMDARFGDRWDTKSWRQHQAEYMVRFPAAMVDALRAVREQLDVIVDLFDGPSGAVAGSEVAMLTGPAGVGKTFLALAAVEKRLAKGLLGVLVHGRWFTTGDPLAQLRDVLNMPSDLTSEDTVSLLDQAGKISGHPVLLVIDALNDTRPRATWRDNLERLLTVVHRHENVRVLLTARSHYVGQVLPPGLQLPRFEHTGFETVEFEAIEEYAAFYGLEPPSAPPMHGEFDNPLYLRLACEALKSMGRLGLDSASMGLGELTSVILKHVNATISDRLDATESDHIVQRAMHAIALATATGAGGAWLSRESAQEALVTVWPERSAEKSLLDALIAQGLLEEDILPDNTTYGTDIVAISFELIGHYLIIEAALKDCRDVETVRKRLSHSFGAIIGVRATLDLGLLEALSIFLADRFGCELDVLSDEIGNDDAIASAVVSGISWRNPVAITHKTLELVQHALTRPSLGADTMTMLFRLAVRPQHPLNADFLGSILRPRSMAQRDAFLVPWLLQTRGTRGAVDRLTRWAREKPLDGVSEESVRLWASALLWTTGATDRRVRDNAAIAAARLLSRYPGLAAKILGTFGTLDDEWIIERALNVTYAALLLSGSTADWNASAEVVWQTFFAEPVLLTSNAAVRDEARSILEGALDRGALPSDAEPDFFRPPYDSPWPLSWPSVADIEPYDSAEYPRLVFSSTVDDFFTYQVVPALRGRDGIDPEEAGRWVVQRAIGLGYRPEWHAPYDRHVIHEYGSGRSTPAWIERIGKKYQWIALQELVGIVSDHVQLSRSKWDPPAPQVPGPVTNYSRQLDPTTIKFKPAGGQDRSWVPSYDWDAKTEQSDADWVAEDEDLPTVDLLNAEGHGASRIVLSGTYQWTCLDESTGQKRSMWIHLHPHLIARADLQAAMEELGSRDLSGTNLTRDPGSHDGYAAEFPFGHHHGESIRVADHEWTEPLAVASLPAVWDILGEYEYAPDDLRTISFPVLAPVFFGDTVGSLRWNGTDGWNDSRGEPIANLRHSVNEGQNELTVSAAWLAGWLTEREQALLWVELSGKDSYGDTFSSRSHPGRLMRTRVRAWIPGTDERLGEPGWYRLPASESQ